ncbi:MAG: hypothetical protein Q4D38_13910, partial [Planctomycetia bacterium]|nr:hypothetical protein [Planctomycetia bacterium]
KPVCKPAYKKVVVKTVCVPCAPVCEPAPACEEPCAPACGTCCVPCRPIEPLFCKVRRDIQIAVCEFKTELDCNISQAKAEAEARQACRIVARSGVCADEVEVCLRDRPRPGAAIKGLFRTLFGTVDYDKCSCGECDACSACGGEYVTEADALTPAEAPEAAPAVVPEAAPALPEAPEAPAEPQLPAAPEVSVSPSAQEETVEVVKSAPLAVPAVEADVENVLDMPETAIEGLPADELTLPDTLEGSSILNESDSLDGSTLPEPPVDSTGKVNFGNASRSIVRR